VKGVGGSKISYVVVNMGDILLMGMSHFPYQMCHTGSVGGNLGVGDRRRLICVPQRLKLLTEKALAQR